MPKKTAAVFQILLILLAADAAVDKYTGQMVWEKELAIAQSNSLEFSVVLNYHSGVRIRDRSSWVGLGFDLNIPYVERIPNGSADEKPGYFGCYDEGYYSPKEYDRLIKSDGNGYKGPVPPKGDYTNEQDYYAVHGVFDGQLLFSHTSLTTMRLPVHFVRSKPYLVDYEIDENDDIYKWTVTDASGVRYIFGSDNYEGILTAKTSIVKEMTGFTMKQFDERIYPNHYVNTTFNFRWYLTAIESPSGDRITVSYTKPSEHPEVEIRDLFHYVKEEGGVGNSDLAISSIFRPSGSEAVFTLDFDKYRISPIYPIEILAMQNRLEFEFVESFSHDILYQGRKCLKEIVVCSRIGSTYVPETRLNFNYNGTGEVKNGLAVGHVYSGAENKGLLALRALYREDATGNNRLLIAEFGYRNPKYGGAYRHDFYGFYSSEKLARIDGKFVSPIGQSVVGTLESPGAEAWSVNRIRYGTGVVEEYDYEPNVASRLTTNEVLQGEELRGGIRVKERKVYDGVAVEPRVTSYTYGRGYATYNFALRDEQANSHSLMSLYTLLNKENGIGDYILRNILVLQGISFSYASCYEQVEGAGIVKTSSLNPSSKVRSNTDGKLIGLKDIHVRENGLDKNIINSYSHCRGLPWKVEEFDFKESRKPVRSIEHEYWANPKLHSYYEPEVEALEAVDCPLGEDAASANPFADLDNCVKNRYAGYVISKGTSETKDGVKTKKEVLSYHFAANGAPIRSKITRNTNSNGKQVLAEVTLAHLERNEDGSFAYPAMKNSNMLTQKSRLTVYANSKKDDNVLNSIVTRWQPANGVCLPTAKYSWLSNMGGQGVAEKIHKDFDIHSSEPSVNADWKLKDTISARNAFNQIIEAGRPSGKGECVFRSTVYGYNSTLTTGSIANARYDECGVLPGDYDNAGVIDFDYEGHTSPSFDAENGWKKGGASLFDDGEGLWGEACIKVVNNWGPSRSFKMYPNTDYIMSAWVKVKASDKNERFIMHGDYRKTGDTEYPYYMPLRPKDGGPTDKFRSFGVSAIIIKAPKTASGEKWQYFELRIPAKSDLNNENDWYALVFYGTPPTETINGGTAYLQDVRFYPADAMVTSTYYDRTHQKPRLTLDANGKPSRRVTYDGFGRPKLWEKAWITNNVFHSWIMLEEREYYLAGTADTEE